MVIPVHGALDKLAACLEALRLEKLDINIILVDDASPEPVQPVPGARLIRNKENRGFPASCNIGAHAGSSPYIVFLNSDVVVFPRWLGAMLANFTDPQVGVVGAKLLFPPVPGDQDRPAARIQHAGLAFPPNKIPYHRCIGWSPDNAHVNKRIEVQAVTGAFLCTRRDLFEKIGGFNQMYGRGTCEDVEYCIAARAAEGYKVVYDPALCGYHYTNGSGQPFPLGYNVNLMLSRIGGAIIWDEWAL